MKSVKVWLFVIVFVIALGATGLLYASDTAVLPAHTEVDLAKWILNGIWLLLSALFSWFIRSINKMLQELKDNQKDLYEKHHQNRETILRIETEHDMNHPKRRRSD